MSIRKQIGYYIIVFTIDFQTAERVQRTDYNNKY